MSELRDKFEKVINAAFVESKTAPYATDLIESSKYFTVECEKIAIQSQIDLLGMQNEELGKAKNEIKRLIGLDPVISERMRLGGKLEGIKLGIEKNMQSIRRLQAELTQKEDGKDS